MKRIYLFPTVAEAKVFLLSEPKDPVFITGAGAAAVAAGTVRAFKAKKPTLAILAGTAAAVDRTLCEGEVVEVTSGCESETPGSEIWEVEPLTGLRSVASATQPGPGAGIVSSEGTAFMSVCEALGMVGCEIRAVARYTDQPPGETAEAEAAARLCDYLTQTEITL